MSDGRADPGRRRRVEHHRLHRPRACATRASRSRTAPDGRVALRGRRRVQAAAGGARPDDAAHGRLGAVPRTRRVTATAESSSSAPATRPPTASRGSSWAPTTTWSSPSTSASCWPGSAPCCGAGAPTSRGWCARATSASTPPPARSRSATGASSSACASSTCCYFLAVNADQVLPRQRLLDEVWGYNFFGDENNVEVYIRYLRQKLGDNDHGASRRCAAWATGCAASRAVEACGDGAAPAVAGAPRPCAARLRWRLTLTYVGLLAVLLARLRRLPVRRAARATSVSAAAPRRCRRTSTPPARGCARRRHRRASRRCRSTLLPPPPGGRQRPGCRRRPGHHRGRRLRAHRRRAASTTATCSRRRQAPASAPLPRLDPDRPAAALARRPPTPEVVRERGAASWWSASRCAPGAGGAAAASPSSRPRRSRSTRSLAGERRLHRPRRRAHPRCWRW